MLDTKVQQPALVATSLAINQAIRSRGIKPDYVVGHSVGEFAALGAAESIGIADAIGLVRERGLAMAEAAKLAPRLDGRDPRPRGRGRRGALPEDPQRLARELQLPGSDRRLGRGRRGRASAASEAEQAGARRAVRLRVSGAFHSPLVARAADRLRPAVEKIHFTRADGARSCRP